MHFSDQLVHIAMTDLIVFTVNVYVGSSGSWVHFMLYGVSPAILYLKVTVSGKIGITSGRSPGAWIFAPGTCTYVHTARLSSYLLISCFTSCSTPWHLFATWAHMAMLSVIMSFIPGTSGSGMIVSLIMLDGAFSRWFINIMLSCLPLNQSFTW